MKQIKDFLQCWGIHSFLLPVFFVLHNYNLYYGLVSVDVAIKVFLKILLLFLFVFFLLLALIRKIDTSLQATTVLGFVILFFGDIKDFFQSSLHVQFISRYTVLLPLMLIITAILLRIIFKKKDYKKSNLYQNLLLLILIFVDVFILLYSSRSSFLKQNLLTKNTYIKLESLPIPVSKPDVYYLVLDSYPGNYYLMNYLAYDNTSFSVALKERGFHVLENPESNYNRTAFSIASTLNFEYLQNINSRSSVLSKDYNQALLTIKQSVVPKIFNHYNYSFYNLSIFDIGDTHSILRENFLMLPEQNMLLYNTLIERFKNDLLWKFLTGKYSIPLLQKLLKRNEEELMATDEKKIVYNKTVTDSLVKISLQKKNSPKFVYVHLYLPHPPYFYNEYGEKNDARYILSEKSKKDKELFLSYLKYTNKVILELINKIMQAGGNNTLIILQSDHGYTDFAGIPSGDQMLFKNYSAFYFPDKNYSALYDTMSNVNSFPVLFNKYFNAIIPLQRDSTVYLPY